MSQHARPAGRRRARTLVAASFGLGALALTGAGVYAGLTAEATGTETVSSGTLKLVQVGGTGSGGFGQTFSDLAPGDSRSVLTDVSDTGTIAARNLVLSVTGTGSTLLTTDATKGLHVTVTSCSVAFSGATCADSGGATTLVNNAAVGAVSGASLVPGVVAKNSAYHYRVTTSLPDSTETTTNGALPTGTVQGLSTTLTFTFSEVQRAGTSTDS